MRKISVLGVRSSRWVAFATVPALLVGLIAGGGALPAQAVSQNASDSGLEHANDPNAVPSPIPLPSPAPTETVVPEPTVEPTPSITPLPTETPTTPPAQNRVAPLADVVAPLSLDPTCTSSCSTLTLTNVVVGGSATPASWALGATTTTDTYTFTSGTSKQVARARTYTLSSTGGPSGYTSAFTCSVNGDVTFDTLTQTVTFPDRSGRTASCTFTYTSTEPTTITVHAGGIRTGATVVGPLPDGAVFTATPVSGSPVGGPFTCVTSGGTCVLNVPSGFQWNITETAAPAGYYLNPSLDFGGSSVVAPDTYAFRTGTVTGAIDVPGPNANGTYSDIRHPGSNYFSGLMATSLDNPAVSQKCGLNVALVLDQSGSMSGAKQTSLKAAANLAVDSLTGTPSNMAIYTFASNVGVSIASTPTSSVASALPLHTFINNLGTPASSTNWDAGLHQVPAGFDIVIFLTDGAPTTYGANAGVGNESYFQYVEQGIYSANEIKSRGTRLVGVGIGLNGAAENLRSVSGATLNSDYYLASDASFGQVLQDLATGSCNNQVSIQKQIQDPSGALIPNAAEANDWSFTNTISDGSTIDASTTTGVVNDQNGFGSAVVSVPVGATPTVSITETTKAGYTFVSAACSVSGTPVTTNVVGTTASFTGASGSPMSCIFTNQQNPGTWSLIKSSDPASGTVVSPGDTVTYTLSAHNDSPVTIFGATATDNISNVIDDATLGTLPAGLALVGSTLTWTIGNLAAGETKTVSYTVTVDADAHGATLTNVATPGTNGSCAVASDCTTTHTTPNEAHLTMVKSVDNGTTGGSKTSSDWTLSAAGGAGASQIVGAESGAINTVLPGTYTLSESAQLAGYTTDGTWVCVGQTGQPTPSTVTIAAGNDVTCTITNTAVAPTLTLQKTVVNEHGGTADAGAWQLSAQQGSTVVSGVSGTPAVTAVAVPVGTYALSELASGVSGYDWTSLSCTLEGRPLAGMSPATPFVTLELGQDVSCFFTNTDQAASLTLTKFVDNNHANTNYVPSDFTLTATPQFDSAQPVVSGVGDPTSPSGVNAVPVFAGTYQLSESGPVGFDASAWTCPGAVSVVGDLVTIANGASVNCQITNLARDPFLTLVKVVVNPDGSGGTAEAGDWTLSAVNSAPGGATVTGVSGTPEVTNVPVPVGTYSLSESGGPSGYSASEWSCVDGTSTTGSTVTLSLDDHVTCTITNTAVQSTLTLNKVVDNANTGATQVAADWLLTASGPTAVNNVTSGTTTNVAVGTYVLSERGPGAYSSSGWDCGAYTVTNDSVTVPLGADVSCTITNTAVAPRITLHKDVVNTHGGTSTDQGWTLSATQNAVVVSGLSGSDAVTNVAVPIGTYALAELAANPFSYDWTSLSCTLDGRPIAGLSPATPNLTLALGQNVECFFTNTDNPALLTLEKTVDNGDTNAGVDPTAFTVTATPQFLSSQGVVSGQGNPAVSGGVSDVPVFAGSYQLSESGPGGFTAGTWECTGAVSLVGDVVTVANGASVYCAIVNTARNPHLTLVKVVDNGVGTGGTSVVGDWMLSADGSATGASSISGYTLQATVTGAPVAVGTYQLSESGGPSGYSASSWVCDDGTTGSSVILELDDNVTCTVTNTAIASTLTLNKVVDNGTTGAAFVASDWALSAAGPTSVADVRSGTQTPVAVGNYSLSEDGPTGYSSSAWDCGSHEVENGMVSVPLGVDVSCTITNTAIASTLTLYKIVENSYGGSSSADAWTLNATSALKTLSGSSGVTSSVPVGTYVMSESTDPGVPGYQLTSIGCMTIGTASRAPSALTLPLDIGLGQTVTCYFTNTDLPASLTLAKSVSQDGANTTFSPADWTVTATPQFTSAQGTVSGSGLTTAVDGVLNVPVFSGTYQLSESGPAGFTAGEWQCEGGLLEGDLLTVANGESASCTILNTAILPKLTLVKEILNDGTMGVGNIRSWTLTADGTATGGSSISGLSGDLSITGATVPAGTYLLTEAGGPSGYETDGFSCVNATPALSAPVDPPVPAYSLALELGDDVTCTILNSAIPAVFNDTKTSDPVTGSVVQPGSTIAYTVTVEHTAGVVTLNHVLTDDLSNVLNNATFVDSSLTVSQGEAHLEGTMLIWNTGPFDGTITITYSVIVNADAYGQTLVNVITPVTGGECDGQCSTTHYVGNVDMGIVKSHTTAEPDGSVVSGKDNLITYQLVVSNNGETEGDDDATGVVVTDTMDFALTLDVAGLAALNPDWAFVGTTEDQLVAQYVANGGVFVAGTSSTIIYIATVGDLVPPGSNLPTSQIDNEGCVAADQSEVNMDNNCSPNVTTAKWILIDPTPFCRANTPYVFYSIPLSNGATPPFLALIWWTPEAFANRTIGIDPADTAAVLADGASQVDTVPIPPGWQNGDIIEGEQLWPGAAVDANGNPIAWPGWTQLPDGNWILDPAAPFYNIRDNAIVEVRTTTAGEAFAQAAINVPGCDPLGYNTRPAGLAFTGFAPLGLLLTGAYVVGIGGVILWGQRRNRRNRLGKSL